MNLFKVLFYRFFQNIARIFWGWNLAWHALAIVLTYIIVTSGFDWQWFIGLHSAVPFWTIVPAVTLGALLPIFVPLVIYIIGLVRKQAERVNLAGAMGQAGLLGLLVSDFYKAFTGRIPPEFPGLGNSGLARTLGGNSALTDISHGFRLGFLRGGVFWGWPSGHTTVAFAVAVTLVVMFPKNKVVRCLALFYALYIGLAVSISIHWFSEFVAGAIIGSVIGMVVGRTFRERAMRLKS